MNVNDVVPVEEVILGDLERRRQKEPDDAYEVVRGVFFVSFPLLESMDVDTPNKISSALSGELKREYIDMIASVGECFCITNDAVVRIVEGVRDHTYS